MATDDPERPTRTQRVTTSTLMKDLMMGKPMWSLPQHVGVVEVENFMQMCRPRFVKSAAWLVAALMTAHITNEARPALLAGFKEFVRAGGEKLVIVTTNQPIANVLKSLAHQAGIKDMMVTHSVDVGSKICSDYYEAAKKAAALKP